MNQPMRILTQLGLRSITVRNQDNGLCGKTRTDLNEGGTRAEVSNLLKRSSESVSLRTIFSPTTSDTL